MSFVLCWEVAQVESFRAVIRWTKSIVAFKCRLGSFTFIVNHLEL